MHCLPTVVHDPTDPRSLAPDVVHVWKASLDPSADELARCENRLSVDERARAARFHFERDRRRYVAARGALRQRLSAYLARPADEIVFAYGERGKPSLAGNDTGSQLAFNVAHSHELALMAFTLDRELGVDLEFVRGMPDAMPIARRHFTPAEAALLAADTAKIDERFFWLWTRKEAVIKGVGAGLATPLDEFDVSSGAHVLEAKWHVVRVPSQPDPPWAVCDLAIDAGYRAALAVAAS